MYDLLTNRITVTRRSAWIVEAAAAAATLTVGAQPSRESRIEVSVAGGQANTGTVAVTGLVAGVTTTELLTFDGTVPVRQTDKLFTSLVAGLTTTGLATESPAPTVSVRAVGRDGSPQHAPSTVVDGWPAASDPSEPRWPNVPGMGRTETELRRIVVAWAEHWAPRNGDLITDEVGDVWVVEGRPKPGGSAIASHWIVEVRLRA